MGFVWNQGKSCGEGGGLQVNQYQQRGFPLRKYFIPGCVGRGLDLDLRIRPAAAASGNPGYTDLDPLGLRSKNKVFERPGP